MAVYPVPHTTEWFEAMHLHNPQEALRVMMMVENAQCAEICSTCGSSPAGDYEMLGLEDTNYCVATKRLCSICATLSLLHQQNLRPFGRRALSLV